jgi:cytochrome b
MAIGLQNQASMPIAKITSHGLRTIAVLVTILWGSIALENAMVRHARQETARALQHLRDMRRKREAVPTGYPVRRLPHGRRLGRL